MNWAEIKEKYKKAWTMFAMNWGYMNPDGTFLEREFLINHYDRKLYDFFDEQGIYISIDHWPTENKPFGLSITVGKPIHEGGFNNRTEAEIAAFTKAFEILEHKLTA